MIKTEEQKKKLEINIKRKEVKQKRIQNLKELKGKKKINQKK